MPPPAAGAVRVRVGATSANLGPGFDSLGLALGLFDDVLVRVADEPGITLRVTGEGADDVGGPQVGEGHLVVRALRAALTEAGVSQPAGLELVCRNVIPHGRGLGSSAAAVVAGLAAGRALAAAPRLDDAALLRLATRFEGHPDNAAAALLGGLTIAWSTGDDPRAVRVEPHHDLAAVLLVPTRRLATHQARSVLPASVSHEDAAANSARAALLVHALTTDPSVLLPATEDRLHQRQRASSMPESLELVDRLRAQALAAVVSGAGPSVLVLTTLDALADVRERCEESTAPGWQCLVPGIERSGVAVQVVADAPDGPVDDHAGPTRGEVR